MNMRGYTLIELLLSMTLLILIGALAYPFSVSFFLSQNFTEAFEEVSTGLRSAQMHAFSRKQSSAFGFRAFDDRFVIFQGDSYEERVPLYDETYELKDGIAISGIQEVVFAPVTGLPSVTGGILLTASGFERNITINAQGKIE